MHYKIGILWKIHALHNSIQWKTHAFQISILWKIHALQMGLLVYTYILLYSPS
jgi:hypothetical protein